MCVLLKEVVRHLTVDKNKNKVTIIIQNITILPERASNAEFKLVVWLKQCSACFASTKHCLQTPSIQTK
jgi:hypothetical protein